MRNRFFIIILLTLILSAIGVNAITIYFFRSQRIDLIDHQIRRSTDILLNSREFREVASRDPSRLEQTISKVLAGERIGKVFIVRDLHDKILYQSISVSLLQADLPTQSPWIAIQAGDQYVRILNSPLGSDLTLQVGLVLDQNFVNWSILDKRTMFFITGLVVSVFIVSVLLTLVLLSPIRMLKKHLSDATADLKNLKDVDPLPNKLLRQTSGFWGRADEFANLVLTTQKLINRINLNYKLTRSWTLQMAHELKTPLSIIRAETESRQNSLPSDYTQTILQEVDWTSETITQFLSWAELENSHPHSDLHAIRVRTAIQTAQARLEKLNPKRILMEINSDLSVATNPGHFDQLITNLLTNALKFSPPQTTVRVTLDSQALSIMDHGSGIPDEVIERLGQPFNIGFSKTNHGAHGNGLGLAWVSTVTKLYGWRLKIESSLDGTKVTVLFPKLN